MNGSHFELGSLGVSISSDSADERSTVEFSVTNSGGTNSTNATAWSPGVLLGPEHRTEEAVALALLPGVLCCCCVALLVGCALAPRAGHVQCARGRRVQRAAAPQQRPGRREQ